MSKQKQRPLQPEAAPPSIVDRALEALKPMPVPTITEVRGRFLKSATFTRPIADVGHAYDLRDKEGWLLELIDDGRLLRIFKKPALMTPGLPKYVVTLSVPNAVVSFVEFE